MAANKLPECGDLAFLDWLVDGSKCKMTDIRARKGRINPELIHSCVENDDRDTLAWILTFEIYKLSVSYLYILR